MSVRLGGIIKQLGDGDVYRLVKGKDVDLTDADLMGAALDDSDLILIDDGAAGTQASTKKSVVSRIFDYIVTKFSSVTSFNVGNYTFETNQTVGAGQDNYVLTYDNGDQKISLEPASSTFTFDGDNFATDLKVGRDADNLIDFTTDNEITFRVSAGDGVVMKASGEIEATKFDGALEGNADTATALATARNIGGVSFDGTGDIDLPGVNTAGDQDTSGTAAVATTVTVADESTDTSCNVLFATQATGNLAPKSGTNLTFNSSSGVLTATGFAGALTGNVTGNVSGTAATVTEAAQSNITSLGTLTTLTVDDITIDGSTISDAGDFDIDSGGNITLDADGGTITFSDAGSSLGTITSAGYSGNSGTATTLATARAINGVDFDGSQAITVPAAGSTLTDTVPVSKGGTGSTSFTDKSVVITQDAGTDTLSSVDLSTAGQIIIGGASGPAAANISAGSGITITNGDNSIAIAATGASQTAGDGLDLSGSEFSLDLKSNGGLVIESTEVAVDLGASSITGTLAVSDGGTGATSLTNDGVLTGGGTSAITSESNVKVSQGTLHVSNATSSASGGVRFLEAADNGTAYTTLQAAADNLNSNPVITMPASTGTMALTSDIPVHTAGDGLTLTGVDFDIDAAQTTITSVLNANLKIGTAATDEYIDFGAVSNVIRMAVNNTTALDVTGSGIEVTGGVSVSGTNNVSCNGNVGDTANNDFVSFGTDGEVSLVTNNSARLTASDTGVSAANMNVTSELNSKKNIFEKTGNTDFSYQGDVVKIGTGSTTQGELCYYKSDGTWGAADADAVATSGGCLLAIALGTDPDSDGMLLRGMFTLDHDPGTIADELYVSTTAGDITNTAPSGNGDIVRIVGYCLDSSNGQIWFNPSNDYIEITA
jgi:hypothetical protein